jgi:hypothetical protein
VAWYFASVPQPGSASASAAPATTATAARVVPAPVATETVRRPDPGIGRGVWEAPPLLFWIVGGAAVVLAVGYAAARMGLLKRRGKKRS